MSLYNCVSTVLIISLRYLTDHMEVVSLGTLARLVTTHDVPGTQYSVVGTAICIYYSRFVASLKRLCRYREFQGFALWWYLHFEELIEIDCKKNPRNFFFENPKISLPKTFP